MKDEERDAIADSLADDIDDVLCDTKKFSQEDSIYIYESIRDRCQTMITAINQDMGVNE